MLAKDAANIFAVRSGLAAETWRVRGELYRQPLLVNDVVTIDVCDGNFCRWNEVIIRLANFKEVLFKFRKLCGSEQAFGVRHERRDNFRVAVFAGVDIEHEAQQGALKAGPQTCK